MKLTCKRDSFWRAFQTAAAVAPSKSPKPILQNVKLRVREGEGTILATDTELGIRVAVEDLQVEVPGSVVFPVSRFGMLLRESTDEQLTMETDGTNTVVRGERSEFELPAANPDEFPEVPEFEADSYVQVPGRAIKQLIHRTIFATESESARYALSGVLLEFQDNRMTAIATDGRRLAKYEIPVEIVGGMFPVEQNTIVPARSLQLIDRVITDEQSQVAMTIRGNNILLHTPQATVSSRLVEGRFPRWRDVMPDPKDRTAIELSVGPLLAAIRQAAVVSDKDSTGIDFQFAGGSVVLSGKTAGVGRSRVELPVAYDGPELLLTLDNRYAVDFLRVLDPASSFTLYLKNAEAAALCMADDTYQYVLMPLSRDRPRSGEG
jgi:DNA polymerase-3 subunit beta